MKSHEKPKPVPEPFGQKMRNNVATKMIQFITYLPHEAVAEVSKDKEPIGRGRVGFKWFESQLMSDSSDLDVK